MQGTCIAICRIFRSLPRDYQSELHERGCSLITVICLTCQLIIDSSQPDVQVSKSATESERFIFQRNAPRFILTSLHFPANATLKKSFTYGSGVSMMPVTAGSIGTGP